VRTLLASALLALACGCADRSSRPSGAGATPSIPGGPDPVVLRVSRTGGFVSAFAYPQLDSALWRSVNKAPAIDAIVAFGAEDGYLAALDSHAGPVRVDLRLGTISTSRDSALRAVASFDGAAIYALTPAGEITRYTPSGGDWKFAPPLPASALFSQADGGLIAAGASGSKVIVWRIRPPSLEIVDTLTLSVGGTAAENARMIAATAGSVGDRVYFGAHESVIAVQTRDMQPALNIDLGDPIVSITATPSGDRLFVALDDDRSVRIVDRFEERVSGKVKLPSMPRQLRMDPLGRVLLARGAGDSVFVVSLADDELLGAVRSAWRSDLPLVLADGTIATARGDDVVLAHPATLADGRVIAGGAKDLWYGLRWNGFRPRAAGLDKPVQFRTSAPRDSSDLRRAPDSIGGPPVGGPPPGGPPVGPPPDSAAFSAQQVFTVSFAAVQSERQARDLASRIRVDGRAPRITTSTPNGTTLYRVVMGPFATREQADRIGRASGQSYWVFEGNP